LIKKNGKNFECRVCENNRKKLNRIANKNKYINEIKASVGSVNRDHNKVECKPVKFTEFAQCAGEYDPETGNFYPLSKKYL